MTKNDDKIEALEDWRVQKEIEDGIRAGITKRIHAVCVTATTSIMGFFYFLGGYVYDHWHSFEAAIKAFLFSERGGQ